MAKKIPNLGPAEWDVLRVLWEQGEASAREVAEALQRQRPLAQTTVATLLTRLREKGLVRHRKSGRGKAFVYQSVLDPAKVRTPALKRFVKQVFSDDVIGAISTLVEAHDLSPAEVRQLRAIVDKSAKSKRRKQDDSRGRQT